MSTGERVHAAHPKRGAGTAGVNDLHVPKDARCGTRSRLTPDGNCSGMFAGCWSWADSGVDPHLLDWALCFQNSWRLQLEPPPGALPIQ
jgi:hypothetical protein